MTEHTFLCPSLGKHWGLDFCRDAPSSHLVTVKDLHVSIKIAKSGRGLLAFLFSLVLILPAETCGLGIHKLPVLPQTLIQILSDDSKLILSTLKETEFLAARLGGALQDSSWE